MKTIGKFVIAALLFAILEVFLIGKASYAQKARYCQSSSRDYINPVIAGVQKVVIAIQSTAPQNKLPPPLKTNNLAKTLQQQYEKRFSSYGGTYLSTATKGCHDRNDQYVEIIDLSKENGWETYHIASQSPETLTILLHQTFYERHDLGFDLGDDVVVLHVSQMRPNVPELSKTKSMLSLPIPVSAPIEQIEKIITRYIKSRIH